MENYSSKRFDMKIKPKEAVIFYDSININAYDSKKLDVIFDINDNPLFLQVGKVEESKHNNFLTMLKNVEVLRLDFTKDITIKVEGLSYCFKEVNSTLEKLYREIKTSNTDLLNSELFNVDDLVIITHLFKEFDVIFPPLEVSANAVFRVAFPEHRKLCIAKSHKHL